ncbi:hypothetical protein A2U01_0092246, partial [Trifolium medium]|nr:hypothetical protein [Trifolium medium]
MDEIGTNRNMKQVAYSRNRR